jgi:hypothetical protein
MIAEIGIVVALYVLARLLVDRWPAVGRLVSILAVAAASVVAIDLGVRLFREGGVASFFSSAKPGPAFGIEPAASDKPSNASVTRVSGGRITTELGYGIAVARDSTLEREWIAVHEPSLPAAFEGTPGVTTVYVRRDYTGDYRYRANFTIDTKEHLRAIQVQFLTFDIWGEHVRTLSFEEVSDIAANSKRVFNAVWNAFSENDVEKHYASIAYIARVRLADGRVVEAPTAKVVEEAKKFSEKFTVAELEPRTPSPGPPGASGS